jgi:S1-C subfamily serine protease
MRFATRRLLPLVVIATLGVQVLTERPTLSARLDVSPLGQFEATQRLDAATVEVLVLGCDLAVRQGSAVTVASDEVLTNAHVVGAFRSVDIAAGSAPVAPASSVMISPLDDVAVIRSATSTMSAITPLSLAPYDPEPGEPVHIAGYPHATTPEALADGLVVASASVVDYVDGAQMGQTGRVMRLNVTATPGMSGGPVLDQAGRLAGLVFAVQHPTNDTLAIPASLLRRVLTGLQPPPAGRCQR